MVDKPLNSFWGSLNDYVKRLFKSDNPIWERTLPESKVFKSAWGSPYFSFFALGPRVLPSNFMSLRTSYNPSNSILLQSTFRSEPKCLFNCKLSNQNWIWMQRINIRTSLYVPAAPQLILTSETHGWLAKRGSSHETDEIVHYGSNRLLVPTSIPMDVRTRTEDINDKLAPCSKPLYLRWKYLNCSEAC